MLRTLVRDEKANILISGGTGAGKTSLLNALIAEIPAEERLGIIEDTREIQAASIVDALNYVIHVCRDPHGSRGVTELLQVQAYQPTSDSFLTPPVPV